MINKILLAYDGSENADAALEYLIKLNTVLKAKVFIIHVVDPTSLYSYGVDIPPQVYTDIRAHGKNILDKAIEKLKNEGMEVEGMLLEGSPATTIIENSDKLSVDMIITGSRGLSTFRSALLGSVSAKLVHDSKVPVLVVKQ